MHFGQFHEWPNPDLRDWRTLFDEGVEQIRLSEEAGFEYCLIAEHHFSNYGHTPSPLLQALKIGERTDKIKIGTAAVILPIWNPIRLAEEVAVLDNLIDGRYICGIGRGYHPYEMGGFNIPVSESRQRFNESLDVLMKAWTQNEAFTYDGHYIKIPTPVNVVPKPMQKPHPPIWLAGTSEDSMRLAAERDFMPMASSLNGAESIRSQLTAYARRLEELGKPTNDFKLAFDTMVYVAPTDEEALSEIQRARWQMRANYALIQKRVVDGSVEVAPHEGELDDETFEDRLFFGSPETVIQKFKDAANLGATHIIAWMMVGGFPHDKLMRSIELMGKEVIPALKHVVPPDDFAKELLNSA